MARVTAEYLTAEFNRANTVLNQALPLLEGADKVQATEIANAYLAALAKQVEAVQVMERGQLSERSPGDGRLRDAATPDIAAGIGERTVAREQTEANARSQEDQALRSNPGAPDVPEPTEALRDEQDLLIDRIETQRLSHRPVHRQ